ncbi:YihA family ribosome biogenesis GTP-binding protein [bacterium]|nr:YihA family ribosome biogenesis GTP-binding protein [bacterium]
MENSNERITLHAQFVKSSEIPSQCPPPALPEYAFIGRSNVGKSSLINYLTERKDLAMTSGKPGKTKTINHFSIDNSWYIVDLPGYGYAQASKTDRRKYDQMIRNYLTRRENLVCTFVLVDARIPPQKIDLEFINWLGLSSVPFEVVFTKADRSKKTDVNENIQSFLDMLGNDWDELPNSWVTSAQKKEGREAFLNRIFQFNNEFGALIAQRFLQNKK